MNSVDLGRYKRRMESYKTQTGQGYIDRMKNHIDKSFAKSPSYFEVEVNGESQGVHIIEGLEGNNFLLTKPDERVKVGDIVLWKEDFYLCIFTRNNSTVQVKAEIQKCNEMLKWRDPEGVVWETPCIVEDKTSVYSDGLSKTKYLSVGTDQVSILVQSNSMTDRLPVDKRFIFSHDSNNIYKTNRKDNILNRGLTLFVAKKSMYDEFTDDLEANLAGFNTSNPPGEDDYESDAPLGKGIYGKESLTIWDDETEYSIVTSHDVVWSVTPGDIIEITRTDGNKCYIKAVGTSKIGKSKLTATIEGEDRVVTKQVELFYQ